MNLSDLKKDVGLFPYTTLRLKATAQYFFEARTREDFIAVYKLSVSERLPLFILGGGSNVAITAHNVKGIVVKNLYMQRQLLQKDDDGADIQVSSGYPIAKLINELAEDGLEGLEYHLGLPGTVGGAIYMNSKWTNPTCYFGDSLKEANLLYGEGAVKTVGRDYFHFAYDYSALQKTGEILLEAVFRLKKSSPDVVRKRAKDALEYRKKTQPFGVFSSGCIFQNINEEERKRIGLETASAGNLIDKAGLKGYAKGSFIVSPHHANFIINRGEGNPDDLLEMIETIKEKVKEKFGIELREEVVVKN